MGTRNDVLGCSLALALVVAIYAVVIGVMAFPVRWAWDAVAVDAFGAPSLTYWQVVAALLLLGIVGGMIGKRGGK